MLFISLFILLIKKVNNAGSESHTFEFITRNIIYVTLNKAGSKS